MDINVVKALRHRFPSIPFGEFVGIVRTFKEFPYTEVVSLLASEEEKVRIEERTKIAEVERRLRVGEQHHRLKIAVPWNIDREHAQAILTYGFLAPGRQGIYAGNNRIRLDFVRENVRVKLGARFSDDAYNDALRFLYSLGLIREKTKNGSVAVSLILVRQSITSEAGITAIRAIEDFLK